MERGSPIREELLYFCDKEISLSEESAHLEFVVGGAPTEDSTGKID
jgi:hypothetical protein